MNFGQIFQNPRFATLGALNMSDNKLDQYRPEVRSGKEEITLSAFLLVLELFRTYFRTFMSGL